jgi:hypothetical protein
MRRCGAAIVGLIALAAILLFAPVVSADGPTVISDCSSASIATEVSSDFSAGGDYEFDCPTVAMITLPATITPGSALTVTNVGAPVRLVPASITVGRFMTISGQTVSLSGFEIEGWEMFGGNPAANGTNGTAGSHGAAGTSLPFGATGNGGNGGGGGPATSGTSGADGSGLQQGGALLIESGTVALSDMTFYGDEAYGQSGGNGGWGGEGGGGGQGGNAGSVGGTGGNGGSGGASGNGGNGGNGSSAEGGAIDNAGTLTITDSTFNANTASGGSGGYGGDGGFGGFGGYGGNGAGAGNGGNGGSATAGGNGGTGGTGGSAEGGAIFNTGTLTLNGNTFSANNAWAGSGGNGANNAFSYSASGTSGATGSGGTGGPPGGIEAFGSGTDGTGGAAAAAGSTGIGGAGGTAAGGAVYDVSHSTTGSGNTFTGNAATGPSGARGPNGGAGGYGGPGGSGPVATPGADGSDGGAGGDATGGAFVTPGNLGATSVCSGNSVTAGSGGAGGAGGPGEPNFGPGSSADGIAGAAGANGTAAAPQTVCGDQLTVTIAAPSDGGGPRPGLGATVPVTVTVAAAADNPDTVTAIGFTGANPIQWSPATALGSSDDAAPAPFNLAPGASQTFTIHFTVQQLDTVVLTSAVSGADPGGPVTASGTDTLYTQSSLQVTVSTDPGTPIPLQDTVNGWVAKSVDAIVTVKNVGSEPVSSVTPPSQFVITVASGTPKVGEIPIDQPAGGPTPATLGTLAPGQSAQATYALNVRGDGSYDLAAAVVGIDSGGGKVSASGDEVVDIEGPELVWKASLPSPSALIKAGTTFVVDIELENNSYQKTLAIDPMHADLTGNAQDGHVQLQGEAIPAADSTASCDAGEAVVLDPRTSDDMEAVIRTAASDPTLTGAAAAAGPAGGTRAEITFEDPSGYLLNDDGTLGAALDPSSDEVIAADSQDFIAHIDDSGFPAVPPKDWLTATYYFSKGLAIGAGQAFAGLIHGVFVDLPSLVGHGVLRLPHALLTYTQLEAELWNDIRDNPAAQAAYLTTVGNQVLLAYKEAPALAAVANEAYASVNAAVLAHYTQLWTQWYAGDWKAAAQTMGEESGDGLTNLGLMLAPCVLTELPSVVETFDAARAAAFARISEELTRFPQAIPWLKAIAELDKVVPGYEFSNRQLLSFAGLTVDQSDFLRAYAKAHDFLIVARTRAAESVRLLKEGLSVLKPELIKQKTAITPASSRRW